MIPIEKNIRVVDEFGNLYEATYLKRAKGLVKKGRAHFIDSNTISLVCPPEKMEDKKLENNKNIIDQEYIIQKIDQIMNEKDYLVKALENIAAIPKSEGPGDVAGAAKAGAMSEVVKSREATNQQMINLLRDLLISIDTKE